MINMFSLAVRGVRFVRTQPRTAVIVVRMAADVAAFSALVRLLPLPRALSLLSTPTAIPSPRSDNPSDERLAQLLDILLASNILCFTPTCWKRAAVLHRQMALRGRVTRVIFGLRKENDDLLAGHAWLESGGHPVFESDPPLYVVTYSFPA